MLIEGETVLQDDSKGTSTTKNYFFPLEYPGKIRANKRGLTRRKISSMKVRRKVNGYLKCAPSKEIIWEIVWGQIKNQDFRKVASCLSTGSRCPHQYMLVWRNWQTR